MIAEWVGLPGLQDRLEDFLATLKDKETDDGGT